MRNTTCAGHSGRPKFPKVIQFFCKFDIKDVHDICHKIICLKIGILPVDNSAYLIVFFIVVRGKKRYNLHRQKNVEFCFKENKYLISKHGEFPGKTAGKKS